MSGAGQWPSTDTVVDSTALTCTWPQYNWSLQGPSLVVAPQPAKDSSCPSAGSSVLSGRGVSPSTGASRRATAMSLLPDCSTHTTERVTPAAGSVVVAVPRRATAGWAGAPLVRSPSSSWKQCPAVMTQVGEMRALEQALS